MERVRAAQDARVGRTLLAAVPANPSDVIFSESPYAAVLYDDQVRQRCDWCFVPREGLLRCSRSRWAHYCSTAHQRAAWRSYYRHECEALDACKPHVPPATVRLAARVLWRRASELEAAAHSTEVGRSAQAIPLLPTGCYADIEAMRSHWEELDDGRKVMYAQVALLTRQYMLGALPPAQKQEQEGKHDVPDVRSIAQLLARFACNNHTVCDEELRPLGLGLYTLAAQMNHSCTPSCCQGFAGSSIVIRALRPLKPGDALTISYVELAATRQERRAALLRHYFFDVDDAPQHAVAAADAADAGDARALCEQLPLHWPLQPMNSPGGGALPNSSGESLTSAPQHAGPHGQGSATLVCHAGCRPPWAQDPADAQLCQMLLLQDVINADHDSDTLQLPGGMCILQQQGSQIFSSPGSSSRDMGTPALVATAAAAATSADEVLYAAGMESLPTLAEGNEEEDSDESRDEAGEAVSWPPTHAGLVGPALPGGDPAGLRGTPAHQRLQQHQQVVHVMQWGDWAAAAALQQATPTPLLAQEAGQMLLHVWALQQAAEQLAARGMPGSAMQAYQQALALADGRLAAADAAMLPLPLLPGTPPIIGSCHRFALGPHHITRARLHAGLLKAAVDEGHSWRTAFDSARALLPVYRSVYPSPWPAMALHLALLAKLELLLEQPAAAAAHARTAAAELHVTHGSDAAVLHEVLRTAYEAAQELHVQGRSNDA